MKNLTKEEMLEISGGFWSEVGEFLGHLTGNPNGPDLGGALDKQQEKIGAQTGYEKEYREASERDSGGLH